MACYTQWNHYLKPGSADYIQRESELRAKFFSLKHVVD